MIPSTKCFYLRPAIRIIGHTKGGLVPGISDVVNDDVLLELLDFLRSERGFDFTDYKMSTIRRRVERRMTSLGIGSVNSYLDHLKADPAEFPLLVDLLLINVTDFFRDREAWDVLAEHLAPRVNQAVKEHRQFRVWCPGCATGEEAYTIAIVLAQLIGAEQFSERVRIFATDIDENALVRARSGNYIARSMESLDPVLRDHYFSAQGGSYVFRADLRSAITFGRHDLTVDPPISRLDLLSFRNTLIYFNIDLQRRVLGRFRAALNPGGLLFLGRSESLVLQQDFFRPVDVRYRIFEPLPVHSSIKTVQAESAPSMVEGASPIGSIAMGVAQAGPFAQFVLDLDGRLIGANTTARAQFSIGEKDLGRLFDDLFAPQLHLSLGPSIETAHSTQQAQEYGQVERNLVGDQMQYLNIVVSPLLDEVGSPVGTNVVAVDVSEVVRLRLERDLAIEDTQALSEELKASIQDLQSTNEELETSNEELQSMNEELETTNDELNSALLEVKSLNKLLVHPVSSESDNLRQRDNVLDALNIGMVVLGDSGTVCDVNTFAERLFDVSQGGLLGMSLHDLTQLLRKSSNERLDLQGEDARQQLTPIAVQTQASHETRCRLLAVLTDSEPKKGMLLFIPEGTE